ncbi:MAG: right-handed parallel beta-helix repeat-containing protein [Alphaproteobacteria bacterium]
MLTALAAGTLGLSSFYPHDAQAASSGGALHPVESLYLETERIELPRQRLGKWPDLLNLLDNTDAPVSSAIGKELVIRNIIRDHIELGQVDEALDVAQTHLHGKARAWALVDILNHLVNANAPRDKSAELIYAVRDAMILMQKEDETEDLGQLYYTLVLILTTLKDGQAYFDPAIVAQSREFFDHIENPDHRLHAIRRIAKFDAVAKIAPTESYEKLYRLLAAENAEKGKQKKAEALINLHREMMKRDEFNAALDSLLAIGSDKIRNKALRGFFEESFKGEETSRALRIALKTDSQSGRVNMFSRLAVHYLEEGYKRRSDESLVLARAALEKIDRPESRAKAEELIRSRMEKIRNNLKKENPAHPERKHREEALNLLDTQGIEAAAAHARSIKDAIYRTKTYRMIAQRQVRNVDIYNVFSDDIKKDAQFIYHPDYNADNEMKASQSHELEEEMQTRTSDVLGASSLIAAPPSELGRKIPAFDQDIAEALAYDTPYIKDMLPLPSRASISRVYYENNVYNFKFFVPYGNAGFTQKQKVTSPDILFIQDGVIDLPAIYDSLIAQGVEDYILKDGKTYTLRRPMLIGRHAGLTLNPEGFETLRLSQDSGAYIINAGKFYVTDVKIASWDEKNQEIPFYKGVTRKREFRPYITAWSGSEIYMASAELIALGYSNAKSYGLSFTWGPREILGFNKKLLPRPTGIIVDSSFNNAYYGFYSYEADDIAVIGNEYVDNVIYGIDPHDRSRRLIFAYNTAYDSQKKHGIIISREVNDSFIVGNLSFDNNGTGIMIDRESVNTIIYGNTTFGNKQDGITIFESDCNLIASNLVFNNKKAGIRTRNAIDLGIFYNEFHNNKQAGIFSYRLDLNSNAAQETRDFDLDPFHRVTANTIIGNTLTKNGTGIFSNPINALFIRENNFIDQSPRFIRGPWFEGNPDALFRYKDGVVMFDTCPYYQAGDRYHACPLREKGIFAGDGQDNLLPRLRASACTAAAIREKQSENPQEAQTQEAAQ